MEILKKKTFFFDKLFVGLIVGIIVPLIAFIIYYLAKFSELNFFDYIQSLHHYQLLFKIMSLCVLTDLPLFYLFIQLKLLRGARGVVMACFIFAFMVMGYRIFN